MNKNEQKFLLFDLKNLIFYKNICKIYIFWQIFKEIVENLD